jgi:hypothetical protein
VRHHLKATDPNDALWWLGRSLDHPAIDDRRNPVEERRDSVKSHGVPHEGLRFTRCDGASRWPVRQGRHRSVTGSKAQALTLDHYLLRHSAVRRRDGSPDRGVRQLAGPDGPPAMTRALLDGWAWSRHCSAVCCSPSRCSTGCCLVRLRICRRHAPDAVSGRRC